MTIASRCSASLFVVLLSAGHAAAQDAANPFTASIKDGWGVLKTKIVKAAATMPEGDYAFKPTPAVRSFGQLIGHLANDHYLICSGAKGEKNPSATDYEKTTGKAELMKALEVSIAYCDGVLASLNDKSGAAPVKLFDRSWSKLGLLNANYAHSSEHYGNLVTYLRIKGQTPPAS